MSLPTVLALSFALHLYIGARLAPHLPWPAGLALAALLLASALLVPMSMRARRLLRPPAADRLAWAGMLFMGLFSSLLVLTFMRDLMLLLLGLANLDAPQWVEHTAAAVPLAALALSLIGLINARRTAPVVRVRVPVEGLPPALDGLRIVQISDIHVGPTIKRDYLRRIVERVNALEPDVVAITGDLVDGSVGELAEHVAPLAQLKSRHGSFFVTGNHEYYSGVHGWVAELQRLGVRVLHNEHVVLRHHGAELVLAGVPDYGGHHFDPRHRSDPQAALRGAPQGAPRVLLAHQPRTAPAAAAAGFDLQLSGHTHGGQFLPWSFFVPLQQPYTAGLHRLGRLWIYVSRGTGYWGPPKRIGAPSEIAELRLSSSA
jgi:uncharacterized protein